MKNIFLIALATLFVSCGSEKDTANCHASVTIINKSNKVIYFDGGSATPEIGYNPLQSGEYFKLIPEASKKDGLGRDRGCYEDLFTENNNKLYYLIFDEQVLLNNTFEDIKTNDKVLKRYSFTVQEMQASNWTITYTGN
jgi:hypothetical protein